MIELSGYVFEVLRKDEDYVLYRGRANDAGSQAAFGRVGKKQLFGRLLMTLITGFLWPSEQQS